MSAAALDRCSDAIIFVPGVMGSELVDRHGVVVWGMSLRLVLRQAALGDALARIALPADGIRASREIQLPMRLPLLSGVEPYANILSRLTREAAQSRRSVAMEVARACARSVRSTCPWSTAGSATEPERSAASVRRNVSSLRRTSFDSEPRE